MSRDLVDLPRLQHLHEGQGSARRPLHHLAHLRDLRRQPRRLLGVRAEHGVRREAAAPGRVGHQPRRGRRVHVRPQHLPGEPGRRRLLRTDGPRDQPVGLGEGEEHAGPQRRRARLQDDRRHHVRAQPVHRRLLPPGAADQPLHPRDVLPDGRPARPPVDALRGRRRHGRDAAALYRLLHAPHALHRVHEGLRAVPRRPVRLHLRRDARLRARRRAAHPAGLLGRVPRSRSTATSPTAT